MGTRGAKLSFAFVKDLGFDFFLQSEELNLGTAVLWRLGSR